MDFGNLFEIIKSAEGVLLILSSSLIGKIAKEALIKVYPPSAVFFSIFSQVEGQLKKVIDCTKEKNDDLKENALKAGLKLAAQLIKTK